MGLMEESGHDSHNGTVDLYSSSGEHTVLYKRRCNDNNNNSILHSSQREIKAAVRPHNEEHISVILSHETHILRHTPPFSQSAYTNRNDLMLIPSEWYVVVGDVAGFVDSI